MTDGQRLKAKRRHDIMSIEKRSALMARIRFKDTKIERLMEQALREVGVDFARGQKVFGKPDFAVTHSKVAVFCDGDFWHGYGLGRNQRLNVKDNRAFWLAKIRSNIRRDREVNRTLTAYGWTVVRFWEHEIKTNPYACARRVKEKVEQDCGQG